MGDGTAKKAVKKFETGPRPRLETSNDATVVDGLGAVVKTGLGDTR